MTFKNCDVNVLPPEIRPTETDWLHGIPPRIQEVQAYFSQKGADMREADAFFLFYEKKDWMSRRGNPIRKWKPFAWRWILSIALQNPWRFDQRTH